MNIYDRFPQDEQYDWNEALRRMWRDGFVAGQRGIVPPIYGEHCHKHGEKMKSLIIGGLVEMFYCEICCLEAIEAATMPPEPHTDRLDTPARPFPALRHVRLTHISEQETQHGLPALQKKEEFHG